MATGTGPVDDHSLEGLLRDIAALDLHEIDPESLREAEFSQTQWILDGLSGKTITKAEIENTRIVIETSDGNRYFFFGFMGSGRRA